MATPITEQTHCTQGPAAIQLLRRRDSQASRNPDAPASDPAHWHWPNSSRRAFNPDGPEPGG